MPNRETLLKEDSISQLQESVALFGGDVALNQALTKYRAEVVDAANTFIEEATREYSQFKARDSEKKKVLDEAVMLAEQALTIATAKQIDLKVLNETLKKVEKKASELDDPDHRFRRKSSAWCGLLFASFNTLAITLIGLAMICSIPLLAVGMSVALPLLYASIASAFLAVIVSPQFFLGDPKRRKEEAKKKEPLPLCQSLFFFRDTLKDAAVGKDASKRHRFTPRAIRRKSFR